jgi:hypothetical protein
LPQLSFVSEIGDKPNPRDDRDFVALVLVFDELQVARQMKRRDEFDIIVNLSGVVTLTQ